MPEAPIANPFDNASGEVTSPAPPAAPRPSTAPRAPVPRPARRGLKEIGRANIVLVVLFLAGIAGVYLMSLRSGPASASAQEQEAEQKVKLALAKLSAVSSRKQGAKQSAREVVNSFYYAARQRQIPLEDLRSNPFEFHKPSADIPVGPNHSSDPEPDQPDPTELLWEEALAAVQTLSLQSVLRGPTENVAMVSNNLLTEGQTIKGWTVQSIRPTQVVLSWKDKRYVLHMER